MIVKLLDLALRQSETGLPRRPHRKHTHLLSAATQKPELIRALSFFRVAPDALGVSASLRSRPNLRTAAIRRGVPAADICSAAKSVLTQSPRRRARAACPELLGRAPSQFFG